MNKIILSRRVINGDVIVRVVNSTWTEVRTLTADEFKRFEGLLECHEAEQLVEQDVPFVNWDQFPEKVRAV